MTQNQRVYKSTVKFKAHRLAQDRKNRDHINELKKIWRNGVGKVKNIVSKKKSDAKYYAKNKDTFEFKEKVKKRHANYYQKNKERISAYNKTHSQIPEVKARRNETSRIRRREHPQSNRGGTIELQIAMNNVRIRDGNSCQWQDCGLTFRDTPIHVHHIFPRSEYPDYEEIEQYMICYCANHHGLWHRYRGDNYSEMIPAQYQEVRGRE